MDGTTKTPDTKVIGDEVAEFNRPQSAAPVDNKYKDESRGAFSSSNKFNSRPSSAAGYRSASPITRPSTPGTQRVTQVAPISSNVGLQNVEYINLPFNNQHESFTSVQQTVPPVVPRFIEREKQVLRFFCYFYDKDVQLTSKPLRKLTSLASTVRKFTLLMYVETFAVEINEEFIDNSGIQAGVFFRKGFLKNSKNVNFQPSDFLVGRSAIILGHEFHFADCDAFTREYYRRDLGIIQPEKLEEPNTMKSTAGAESATGLGLKYENPNLRKSLGTRSVDYLDRKVQLDKTNRFLHDDQRVLRFRCLETTNESDNNIGLTAKMIGGAKEYALSYYLHSDMVEIRTMKGQKTSSDDATLLLKKSKLAKNWRQMSSKQTLYYYTPDDFLIGNVVDCFGRMMLLVGCDDVTRSYYREKGIDQIDIEVITPSDRQLEVTIPKHGDGYLGIGSEQDTLHTIYGHPKPSKNWKKVARNRGIIIRCKTKLLAKDVINNTRVFNLTFFLEDDTVAVYEEIKKNSGIVGGSFLKRGVYVNGLPPDTNEPRSFCATDIYLGNVIALNGFEMQITEMDDLSVIFCEENCDEFPFFDTFAIIHHLMGRVSNLQYAYKCDLCAYVHISILK